MSSRSESETVRHLVQAQVTAFQRTKRIELTCRLLKRIIEEHGRALIGLDLLEQSFLEELERVGRCVAGHRNYAVTNCYLEVLSAHAQTFDSCRERLTAAASAEMEAIRRLI